MSAEAESLFRPVISAYTRAQAIDDGVLVDVSAAAREVGISWPVAMTQRAWEQCVEVPAGGLAGQDERGRLHDVVWMLAVGIRAGHGGTRVDFSVLVRSRRSHAMLSERDRVRLYALAGPGDHGEPVITVMMPGED